MSVPSVLVALRMLLPLNAVRVVEVSILPVASTRPTSRRIAPAPVVLLVVRFTAPPGAASYPVKMRYWPSAERVSIPSVVAVPLAIRALLLPESVEAGKKKNPTSGVGWPGRESQKQLGSIVAVHIAVTG